jgi:hypothetical protein
VYRNLKDGERIVVDTASVVAIEESIVLGVAPNGRCGMCCFGGEGCCATTLTGPGKVFLQVRPRKPVVFCATAITLLDDLTRGRVLSTEHELSSVPSRGPANDRRSTGWRPRIDVARTTRREARTSPFTF